MSTPLVVLLISSAVSAAILFILVMYGNTLALKEDDQFHLNKVQEGMASEQGVVLGKIKRLKRLIVAFAVICGVLLLSSASLWVWIGFRTS